MGCSECPRLVANLDNPSAELMLADMSMVATMHRIIVAKPRLGLVKGMLCCLNRWHLNLFEFTRDSPKHKKLNYCGDMHRGIRDLSILRVNDNLRMLFETHNTTHPMSKWRPGTGPGPREGVVFSN